MKLCFPIDSFSGMDSPVSHHFGAAPYFIIYNTETKEPSLVNMQDLQTSDSCNPSVELANMGVEIVITAGIGPGALHRLMDNGVHVFQAKDRIVSKDLEHYNKNALTVYGYDTGKCDCNS